MKEYKRKASKRKSRSRRVKRKSPKRKSRSRRVKRKSPKRKSRSRRVKRKSPKRKSRSRRVKRKSRRRVKRKSPVKLNFFGNKKKYYTCDVRPGSRGQCLEFNKESDCEKYKKVGKTCSKYRNVCENSCIRHILRSDRRKVEEIKSRIKKFDRQKDRNVKKATREEVSKLRKDVRFLRSKANEQKKMAVYYKKNKDEKNFIKHARIYKKIIEKINEKTIRANSYKS